MAMPYNAGRKYELLEVDKLQIVLLVGWRDPEATHVKLAGCVQLLVPDRKNHMGFSISISWQR